MLTVCVYFAVSRPATPRRFTSDQFRAAGTTVIASNLMARTESKSLERKDSSSSGITAHQAMTRLTGVIFDNEGEVPAPFRKAAITTVETIDNMRAQMDAYKPLVEQLVYWENLKIAIFFTTGISLTWFAAKLGLGFGYVLCILIMVGGAFRRNQQRLRRKVKGDLTRQMAMKKLETDSEPVEWMNLFLTRFWLIFEPSLSAGIKASVDAVLEASKPGFLVRGIQIFAPSGHQLPNVIV